MRVNNIKKSLLLIVKEILDKKFLIILILFINYLSYRKAFDFFFWRDDWAFLWSSTYNPDDFYRTTVGDFWFIRTGLFHLFFYQLHSILGNSLHWQLIGFSLKVINTFIFYYLVKQITKNNYLANSGALIFSSYTGGMEAYTWHLPTALVITFLLLSVLFYSKYTERFKLRNLIFFLTFLFLALLSYVGRVFGIFPLLLLWNILICFKDENRDNIKIFIKINVFLVLAVFAISKFMPTYTTNPFIYLLDSLKYIRIYFESIGNLLKIPFIENIELGGLAADNKFSFILGMSGLVVWFLLFLKFIKARRNTTFLYSLIAIAWIYSFYLFNWLYGGGGVTTLVGSVHRYLSVSSVGVILLTVLLIDLIPKKLGAGLILFLIVINISHADRINKSEGSVRYRQIVEPVYHEIINKTNNSTNVEVLIVDAPNKLKSFVVLGWLPYTFAYYNGLSETKDFPLVIPHWESAIEWVCSTPEQKKDLEVKLGVVNYRGIYKTDLDKVFAFRLEVNGQINDKTENFRNTVIDCLKT